MVERHIFSPEPDMKGTYKSPLALKLEKELMFTGVIISPKGKWAMIREKGSTKETEVSGLRKEGDEIQGMVIKEIGSNFLKLAGQGKEVRLNLYHEGKLRPAIPMESQASYATGAQISGDTPAMSTAKEAKASSPSPSGEKKRYYLPQETKKSTPVPQKKSSITSSAINPFLKDNPDPFLTETPPDPLLQETPPNPFQEEKPPSRETR